MTCTSGETMKLWTVQIDHTQLILTCEWHDHKIQFEQSTVFILKMTSYLQINFKCHIIGCIHGHFGSCQVHVNFNDMMLVHTYSCKFMWKFLFHNFPSNHQNFSFFFLSGSHYSEESFTSHCCIFLKWKLAKEISKIYLFVKLQSIWQLFNFLWKLINETQTKAEKCDYFSKMLTKLRKNNLYINLPTQMAKFFQEIGHVGG